MTAIWPSATSEHRYSLASGLGPSCEPSRMDARESLRWRFGVCLKLMSAAACDLFSRRRARATRSSWEGRPSRSPCCPPPPRSPAVSCVRRRRALLQSLCAAWRGSPRCWTSSRATGCATPAAAASASRCPSRYTRDTLQIHSSCTQDARRRPAVQTDTDTHTHSHMRTCNMQHAHAHAHAHAGDTRAARRHP
jgi:hypothetical protein